GGMLKLHDGAGAGNYVTLEYNQGYPQIITDQNNFAVSFAGGNFRANNAYMDYVISGTSKFYVSSGGQVGIGTATPAASSLLDITSTTKGFLPPRMTGTEKGNIVSPATGLVVYDTTANALSLYNGTGWGNMLSSTSVASGGAGYIQVSDGSGGLTTSGTTTSQQFFWDTCSRKA
ncbi:MAG: hypothetical protein KGQ41_09410, partial [Alphaproteobacteria bacterium]|nr:hypothetical protein [Alphaproteobacteria bacterium]